MQRPDKREEKPESIDYVRRRMSEIFESFITQQEIQGIGHGKTRDIKVPDYETNDHVVHASLDIQIIEDFITNTARVYREIGNPGPFIESFYVSVYPNGADEKTEGLLVVFPNIDVSNAKWIPKQGVLRCTISLMDVEGNYRFPKTFERLFPFDSDHGYKKYFERSFILDRADEFLPEGILTVRCDFYFTWRGLETSWDTFGCDVGAEPSSSISKPPPLSDSLKGFLSTIPQSVCCRNGAEAEDSSDKFTVFDFTHRILTLPQFHESRERFGVYGIPTASSSLSSDSKEESTDALEHIWIFDTRPDRFLLSLEERQDNVGFRFLEASHIMRQCVNVDMKEKREKRVEFSEMDSRTFIIVLYFLENKTIPPSTVRELVDVYTFSHLHEMKGLQQKCSEEMVRSCEFPNDLEELKRMASLYSDEYLSSLLDSRWHEFENLLLMLPRPIKDDRPDSDSYI